MSAEQENPTCRCFDVRSQNACDNCNVNENAQKLPFQRLQIPLRKCVNVYIPFHLDVLKKHHSNIEKFQYQSDNKKLQQEVSNAKRAIQNFHAHMQEMEIVHSQVRKEDLSRFEKELLPSKLQVMEVIESLMDLCIESQQLNWGNQDYVTEFTREQPNSYSDDATLEQEHAQVSKEIDDVMERRATLDSLQHLEKELQCLKSVFHDLFNLTQTQAEVVDTIENHIETAQQDVKQGTKQLSKAAKLKTTLFPMAGTIIGGCLGGPVGLIIGLKIGAVAAVGGGFLGYMSGRFIQKRQQVSVDDTELELQALKTPSTRESTSLPNIYNTSQQETAARASLPTKQ